MKRKLIKQFTMQDMVKASIIFMLIAFLICFLLFPLCTLFLKAFQNEEGSFIFFDRFADYFSSSGAATSILNTLTVSVSSTIIAVTVAFILAYSLSRKPIAFRKGFQFISMVPIFAPTMLLGLSLIYLFGNQGILTQMGIVIPLYGQLGITIAESIYCMPIALMILSVAFSAADYRLYEAADVMGTTSLKKMLTITLPNVRYGLISAIFVCFTYSFTDFGAPSVVGGSYNVLATDIYKQVVGQQNFNMGAVVGLIMMGPAIISFFVDRYVSSKQVSAISSKAVPYQIKKSGISDKFAFIFCCLTACFIIAFFGMSLYASFVTFWPYRMELTLDHYDFGSVAAGGVSSSISNSLVISIITAVLGTCITFFGAYSVEKIQILPKARKLLHYLSISPMAIPGTVVGLSYILFFNAGSFPIPGTDLALENIFNPIYGTIAILILVNIIHYYAVPYITASTALKRLDSDFEVVSDSLRVPFYKTLFRITMPMSMGAIFEMFIYYFVNSMITISAVVFLYTPDTKPASVAILNVNDAGDIAAAAAISMILLGINIVGRGVYEIFSHRMRQKTDSWLKRN